MKRFYEFKTNDPERRSFTVNVDHIRLFLQMPEDGDYLVHFDGTISVSERISKEQYEQFMATYP